MKKLCSKAWGGLASVVVSLAWLSPGWAGANEHTSPAKSDLALEKAGARSDSGTQPIANANAEKADS